jgi:hypothetical protein
VKVKAGEIWNSQEALAELVNKMEASEVPAVVKYLAGRIIKATQPEVTQIAGRLTELAKKYNGELPKSSGAVKFDTKEHEIAFLGEWTDILKAEIELSVQPISVTKLGNLDIRTGSLMALDWCLEI